MFRRSNAVSLLRTKERRESAPNSLQQRMLGLISLFGGPCSDWSSLNLCKELLCFQSMGVHLPWGYPSAIRELPTRIWDLRGYLTRSS
jgi:hypothetical protein